MDAGKDVDNRAAIAKNQFCNRSLAATKEYPEISQLPVPVQKLLAIELDAVTERIVKGKEAPTGYDGTLKCNRKFHRQYLLPCRHIFHLDTVGKVLGVAQWEIYLSLFQESGMEVYETIGTIWVDEESNKKNTQKMDDVIRVQASVERLKQQLYSVHETMDMKDIVQGQRVNNWVNHVEEILNSLTDIHIEDITGRNRPWEL